MQPRYVFAVMCGMTASAFGQEKTPGVFEQPLIMAQYASLQNEATALMRNGDNAEAQKKCEQSIRLAPQYPGAHYNLCCALARQNKKDEAFASLTRAIEHGFSEARHLQNDPDLENLRGDERFQKAVDAAAKAKPLAMWPAKVEPGKVKDGIVEINDKNTAWQPGRGFFVCFLEKPDALKEKPISQGWGEVTDLLVKWHKEGTAAGHVGDFYDNHDEDHSSMNFSRFPQLARIRFGPEVKAVKVHRGLQTQFFYSGVVLGNASVALVSQPYWRSMTRLAYTDARLINVLYNQYTNSHMYFYPEHRDHDPGHNGKGDGYGDTFPANTPYVITSQGSSGSDVVFMDAVAATLAAFRPEVKQRLIKEHALMPAVQMIFRSSNKNIKNADDYLTGKAHPSVFEGGNIDVVKMIKMAHDIKPEDVPPLVTLRVVEEEKPVLGRDCFDVEPRGERLFDTPCSIARVMRTTKYERRMTVSAADSRDPNGRALKYHWVLLRGDPKKVSIKPLDKEGTKAELVVGWQERRPVEPGSKLESNRVDIGVFVHNGTHYSAPAFVTFYGLDNEKRTYDEKHRIKEIDYNDAEVGKNYIDPAVELKKNWRDEYQYDDAGKLIGWTRHREKAKEEFTADGALVLKKDDKGRAIEARTVKYVAKVPGRNQAPVTEQQPGDEKLIYEYASDDDRIGKVKTRTPIKDL
jgi:hypothetical protein